MNDRRNLFRAVLDITQAPAGLKDRHSSLCEEGFGIIHSYREAKEEKVRARSASEQKSAKNFAERLRLDLDPCSKTQRRCQPKRSAASIYELRTHQIELEIQNEELRTAQVELSAARDRYVDLYDYAPAGYLTLDENGLILEANLTVAEMLDRDRRRLLKQPFSNFIADEAKDTYYRYFRQLRQTESRQSSELMMRNHHGGMFFVRLDCRPHIDAEEAALRLRVSLTDITKLKDAEHHLTEAREAAQSSLAQFRAVYEHTDVGLVFSDAEGNLNNWNPAALAMVGFNSITEGTQHVNYFPLQFELYLPNGQLVPFENWPIMRVLRGEEFTNYELHLHRTDTHLQRILSISGSCIRDKNGEIVQTMLTMRDLTAIRATEEALQKAKEAADQANTAKSRFLAAVSHDLRQPLQTVTLLSGVLSRKTSEPQTGKIIEELRAGLHSMKGDPQHVAGSRSARSRRHNATPCRYSGGAPPGKGGQ